MWVFVYVYLCVYVSVYAYPPYTLFFMWVLVLRFAQSESDGSSNDIQIGRFCHKNEKKKVPSNDEYGTVYIRTIIHIMRFWMSRSSLSKESMYNTIYSTYA